MSRLFGFALLLGIVASSMLTHGTTAQDATPCAPLTEEEATAWVTAYFTAWNSNDSEQVIAHYAPDAIHHWGLGVDTEGTEEMATSLDAFFAAFPGVRATVDRVWVAGDTVIARWISIGIQEGDFLGVPGSLDTVTWTGINIWQLDCGKVTESWAEADNFGRLQQMGLIPIVPEAEATPAA